MMSKLSVANQESGSGQKFGGGAIIRPLGQKGQTKNRLNYFLNFLRKTGKGLRSKNTITNSFAEARTQANETF